MFRTEVTLEQPRGSSESAKSEDLILSLSRVTAMASVGPSDSTSARPAAARFQMRDRLPKGARKYTGTLRVAQFLDTIRRQSFSAALCFF